ncbi:MAG: preprotein translocase subunit YajC [Succinatimonas hippei]|nr:preprotein translocase subunit YajC [Succinatimonas hippei]
MNIISQAYAADAAPAAGQAGGDFSMIIVLAVCMIAIYFFIMRPNNKKRKEMQKLLDNLAVGDEVLTNGGIAGRITKLPDNREYVLVAVSEGTVLQMKRNYIVAVLPRGTLISVAVDKKAVKAQKNSKRAEKSAEQSQTSPAAESKAETKAEDKAEDKTENK